MLKRLVLLSLLLSPIMAWAFVKPVRVVAPELTGVSCIDDFICIDELGRTNEASQLYKDAIDFVQSTIGQIENKPRAIFCSSKECSRRFGLYNGSYAHAGAYNVGTYGLVISYRGWEPYFIRHELIHHLQNEKLGSLNMWFFKPAWFREGMAYSLSQDPRKPLAGELEGYRSTYDSWVTTINPEALWEEAAKL